MFIWEYLLSLVSEKQFNNGQEHLLMQSLHIQDAILIIYVCLSVDCIIFYMPFYKNDIIATRSIHYVLKVCIVSWLNNFIHNNI